MKVLKNVNALFEMYSKFALRLPNFLLLCPATFPIFPAKSRFLCSNRLLKMPSPSYPLNLLASLSRYTFKLLIIIFRVYELWHPFVLSLNSRLNINIAVQII